MKNNKGAGNGKVIAIVAVIVLVVGLIIFFVMGAIKKSKEGPGGGPGGKPQRPPREGGSIQLDEEWAYSELDDMFYIAA